MKAFHAFAFAALVLLLALPPSVSPAVVRGNTYDWLSLDPLPKAVVSVNTTPRQIQVAENGAYSFQLPPGAYELVAEYREGNETTSRAQENLSISPGSGSGEYVVDLLLFPTEEFFPETLVEVPDLNVSLTDIEQPKQPAAAVPLVWVFAGIVFVALVFPVAMLFYLRKKHVRRSKAIAAGEGREPQSIEVSVVKTTARPQKELSAEQQELLDKIRAAGGSIGQKDLRHAMHVSEAKASMLVSELEAAGLLKRIKKGRGNLIKILG